MLWYFIEYGQYYLLPEAATEAKIGPLSEKNAHQGQWTAVKFDPPCSKEAIFQTWSVSPISGACYSVLPASDMGSHKL